MKPTLLLLEDDDSLRETLARSIARRNFEVHPVARVADAIAFVNGRDTDVILADMRLPDGTAMELIDAVLQVDPEIRLVVMTAYPEVSIAVEALKRGAHDFIVKPFELEELHLVLARALENKELRTRLRGLERERGQAGEILGRSEAIERVREQITRVAATDTPVLVLGETGTGKELVADAIHRQSARRARPLIKINCSALPEHLLESELFGHERGAFTDAREMREGLFESANGGTLFLDEIGEMKPDLQARLLRVVEGKPFHRLGGRREIHTDVRIVAATHRDLKKAVVARTFREDLYYRLNVFQLALPPLRDRGDDAVVLAEGLLTQIARNLRRGPLQLDDGARAWIRSYAWPGNIRELRNVLERAAILSEGDVLDASSLPSGQPRAGSSLPAELLPEGAMPSLREVERRYIDMVMENVNGNISEAARVLGVARNTLKARIKDDSPS